MRYVLVTGGVVSGLGKGVTASSVGVLLKACGHRVTSIKIGTSRCPENDDLKACAGRLVFPCRRVSGRGHWALHDSESLVLGRLVSRRPVARVATSNWQRLPLPLLFAREGQCRRVLHGVAPSCPRLWVALLSV